MIVNEVLQALDELAERYEATARSIRAVRAEILQTELAREAAPETDGSPVSVSEAIRRVLGGSRAPMRPAAIWHAIRANRIPLRTQSDTPKKLVSKTLQSMAVSRQVRREPDGWVLS